MKRIKLILLSMLAVSMLTSCGTGSDKTTASPSPTATTSSGNVDNGSDGSISDTAEDMTDEAGNAVKDAGDAVGDAATDIIDGADNAVNDVTGANDTNNNNG